MIVLNQWERDLISTAISSAMLGCCVYQSSSRLWKEYLVLRLSHTWGIDQKIPRPLVVPVRVV